MLLGVKMSWYRSAGMSHVVKQPPVNPDINGHMHGE